ncbi:HNH endonuclease [Myxococcota bacterium]|nr:HNH endonuclease [Myxococcota bacterium]MBU1534500.1 HNH endonuclease [Myxococcota bacterium]
MAPKIETVGQHLYYAYARLGQCDAAKQKGCEKYSPIHFMIMNKLYKGLNTGTMSVRSLYDDEKLRMKVPQACYYCGSRESLSLDHLVAKKMGGSDDPANFIYACKTCNSAKGKKDLFEWYQGKGKIPPLMIIKRYLKLVFQYAEAQGLMEAPIENLSDLETPFRLDLIPTSYLDLQSIDYWVYPEDYDGERIGAAEISVKK